MGRQEQGSILTQVRFTGSYHLSLAEQNIVLLPDILGYPQKRPLPNLCGSVGSPQQ